MVGKEYEAKGIAKHGAKMVNAVACAKVPKITVIIGGSYGAGNYAMCGRAYCPDFLYMWPNARISVMGGSQAADVLNQIKQAQNKRRGKTWDEVAQVKFKKMVEAQYDHRSHAYYASARIWDDNVINPLDTRFIIGLNLATIQERGNNEPLSYGVFRM
jgi:3-methylcrotonyl-CoA carboxylase beta subunit